MTPEEVKALPLGAPVTYSATLTRTTKHMAGWRARKAWTRFELDSTHPAVFIGWRSLVDGWRDAEDEVGYVFEPDEATRQVAALVAYDPRCNPILIPCDALCVVVATELALLRELRADCERWRESGGDRRDQSYILDTLNKLEEHDATG